MPHTFADAPELALRDYAAAGFHLEPDVVEHGLCDRMIRIANEFPAVKQGDYRTVLQPHRHSEAFLEAMRHPRVVRIVRQMLGDEISGIQTQFFYGKPGTPGFQPHQDNRFVNALPGTFASAWVALSDVSKENGGLYIYPGTHKEPLLDVVEIEAPQTMLQDANALRLHCIVPARYKPVDLVMPKGSAAFFHGHTVHGSHNNVSNRHRYALLMTYLRRGTPFLAGRYAHREEVTID